MTAGLGASSGVAAAAPGSCGERSAAPQSSSAALLLDPRQQM